MTVRAKTPRRTSVTKPKTLPPAAVPRCPTGLEVKGKRLWRDVQAKREPLGPGEAVLLEEACRMADRLDRLASAIDGADFVTWVQGEDEDAREFRLVVDAALVEARLTATALRGVLVTLDIEQVVGPRSKAGVSGVKVGDPIDDIAARRAARRGTGT